VGEEGNERRRVSRSVSEGERKRNQSQRSFPLDHIQKQTHGTETDGGDL
jgi:hypothetical protein